MYKLMVVLVLLSIMAASEIVMAADGKQGNDIYFVIVASENYLAARNAAPAFPSNNKLPGKIFHNPSGAIYSARKMEDALIRMGSHYGIFLKSSKAAYVGRDDILKAITDIKRKVRVDNVQHPIMIFYYIGHGIGDPVNRYLYLVPGNFCPRGYLTQTYTMRLLKTCMWSQDIIMSFVMFRTPEVMSMWDDVYISDFMPDLTSVEDMTRVGRITAKMAMDDEVNRTTGKYPAGPIPAIPYIILFDNCYRGVEENLTRSGTSKELDDIFGSLKKYLSNKEDSLTPQIEDGGLVLYAARPGENVGLEHDPFPPNGVDENMSRFFVGPLARRFLKIIAETTKQKSTLSIGGFLEKMESPELDKDTKNEIPTTYSAPKNKILETILFDGSKTLVDKAVVENRDGTSVEPAYCCGLP
jgi:hypothetical protein